MPAWRGLLTSGVALAALAVAVSPSPVSAVVPYDIVYVRQVRFGDGTNTTWPEVAHPARIDPGVDLMLLHPDGREEVLVAGGVGAVTDPFVSFRCPGLRGSVAGPGTHTLTLLLRFADGSTATTTETWQVLDSSLAP